MTSLPRSTFYDNVRGSLAADPLSHADSFSSFLDLREANIADDSPLAGDDRERGARPPPAEPSAAEDGESVQATPRAAPCIALPRQNAELLRHFAIGAPWALLAGQDT
jgi:hypothetical protein